MVLKPSIFSYLLQAFGCRLVAFFDMKDFKFKKFIPISKINDEERMVYGWASTPDLDSDGEIVSLDAIQKALPAYLQYPTLREMHMPKVAGTIKNSEIKSGKQKGLYIGAKVVADDAWNLVKEGVYRGFSIGGNIINKVNNIIQELELVEISLVDVPANKKAKLEIWKKGKDVEKFIASLERISFEDGSKAELIRKVVKETMEKELKKHDDELLEEDKEETDLEEKDVEKEVPDAPDVDSADSEEDGTEIDENEELEDAKEASATVTLKKINDVSNRLDRLTKSTDKMDLSKGLNAVASALSKMTSVVESMEKRIASLESLPASTKAKASFVNKGVDVANANELGTKEVSKVTKIQDRLNELNDLRDSLGASKFASMGYSQEASKLLSELDTLNKS